MANELILKEDLDFDPTDPVSIVNYLVCLKGQLEVSLADLEKFYLGPKNGLSVERLLADERLGLTERAGLIPLTRLADGDIAAKIKAYSEAVAQTDNEIFRRAWLKQIDLLNNNINRIKSYNITFSMLDSWIPKNYILTFLSEENFSKIATYMDKYITYSHHDGISIYLVRFLNKEAIRKKDGPDKWFLLELFGSLDDKFNDWLHNHVDIANLVDLYNNKFYIAKPRENENYNFSINEFLSGKINLYNFQIDEVKRLYSNGRGICAFDVGLGKTIIALALVGLGLKYGTFNRVLIATTLSVLETWIKEINNLFNLKFIIENILIIDKIKDLQRITTNNYKLVLTTKECLVKLPVKEESIKNFYSYINDFCPYISKDKDLYWEQVTDQTSLPYFEDCLFDTLILDESHLYKNSFKGSGIYNNIAYLSHPSISKQAINVLSKTCIIRQKNKDNKGVFCFTATPLTNTPYEIINSLSLICDINEFKEAGLDNINDIIGLFGKIKLANICKISGEVSQSEALLGFRNLDVLRNLFNKYVLVRSYDDPSINLKIPDKSEIIEDIDLNDKQTILYDYLRSNALNLASKRNSSGLGCILSIISDMDRLTIDYDTYTHRITYLVDNEYIKNLEALSLLLPDRFDQYIYDKFKMRWILTEDIVEKKLYKFDNNKYALNLPETMDSVVINLAKEVYLDISTVTHPINPKFSRLLDLLKKYYLNGGNQIIFIEEKIQHTKLKRIISNNLNISQDLIAIINSSEVNRSKLDHIIEKFDSGQIRFIIGNRKIELGLNLQTNTTAIHHLTLPWTPTSVYQRNGRGVRQGNQNSVVAIHYYFGNKTFDQYRHTTLQSKANWLGELVASQASVMSNGQAIDFEELLDLLANSPEEAQARRNKRAAATKMLEEEKRKYEVYSILFNLTIISAKKSNLIKTIYNKKNKNSELKTNSSDLNNKLLEINSLVTYLDDLNILYDKTKKYFIELLNGINLPFGQEILDNINHIVVVKPNLIFNIDQIYYIDEITMKKFFYINKIEPNKNGVSINILSPVSKYKKDFLSFKSLSNAKISSLQNFILENTWKYSILIKLNIISKDEFDKLAPWINFNRESAVIYKIGPDYQVAWDSQDQVPDSAVPVWPEVEDSVFREAIFQSWAKAKREGRAQEELMTDLFGPEYEVLALKHNEGVDDELMGLIDKIVKKTNNTEQTGELNKEKLIEKINKYLKFKTLS
ncbi:MAG: DEAD/DEAH box helicase family protein [Deltaproteobacteria bacterium]|jgi:superfamily II DNA or RNA helicase|nr:DEAD/DEAH box helicase family protein [Deltaproteobacteria bacterium]